MADNAPKSDPDVETLVAITGGQLSVEQARKFLSTSGDNLEAAANKFFEQGLSAIQDDAYDASAWHADRYGQNDASSNPSKRRPDLSLDMLSELTHAVRAAIEFPPGLSSYPHSRAPTRPPSRTSNRSGDVHMGDAPIPSVENYGQESGVIGSSGPVFGPATKEYYDNKAWAMVPISSATEYIPDPVASQRKREENAPAILKPLPNQDYLPSLLTILHSIPLFREAFLTTELTIPDYSGGSEWWKGTSITRTGPVDYDANSPVNVNDELDLIHETQRLMAFLDSTDRAYGSVEPLCQLEALKVFKPDSEVYFDFHKFLMAWGSAIQHQAPGTELNGFLRTVVDIGDTTQESWLLDATAVHPTTEPMDIYDVLDEHIFSEASNQFAAVTMLPHVLMMRIAQSDRDAKSLDVRIPSTFYADRYMAENSQAIKNMYQERKHYENQISDIDTKVKGLKIHRDKNTGKELDSLLMLRTTMKAFEPREDDLIEDPKNAAVLEQLKAVYENVERKLKALDEQRSKVQETLQEISSIFKGPIDDPSASPEPAPATKNASSSRPTENLKQPFKLRGVSTRSNIVYLLHPDIQSDVPRAMQWWQVQYVTESSEPIILREKVTESFVLEKASAESSQAFLVYADEFALSAPVDPLPKPLEHFVKRDNILFLEELQQETEGISATGNWDNGPHSPPAYHTTGTHSFEPTWIHDEKSQLDYEEMSGKDWLDHNQQHGHNSNGNGSALSSTTLTPNTEGPEVEMKEVNSDDDRAFIGVYDSVASRNAEYDVASFPSAGVLKGKGKETPREQAFESEPDMDTEVEHIEFSGDGGNRG